MLVADHCDRSGPPRRPRPSLVTRLLHYDIVQDWLVQSVQISIGKEKKVKLNEQSRAFGALFIHTHPTLATLRSDAVIVIHVGFADRFGSFGRAAGWGG